MSVVSLPVNLPIAADGGFMWGQQRYDLTASSDTSGASQTRSLGPSRWTVSFRCPPYVTNAQAAEWQVMQMQVRGRTNHLAVFDVARPYPRGTARGNMSLYTAAAAGATSTTITGGDISGTLSKGDKLQISTGVGTSQLVMLTTDTVSNPATPGTVTWTRSGGATVTWTRTGGATVTWTRTGTIPITFEPPLRLSFPAGTAVTWAKPLAYFKATTDSASWGYHSPDLQQGYSWDGLEDFTP